MAPLDKLSGLEATSPGISAGAWQTHFETASKENHLETTWSRMLKTNFDGAVFEDLNAEGICVVVCNSPGEIMVA